MVSPIFPDSGPAREYLSKSENFVFSHWEIEQNAAFG